MTSNDILCILVVIIIVMVMMPRREGLTSRPNEQSKKLMANQIMDAAHMFNDNSSLDSIRTKIGWMDAVTYEDMRKLSREGMLNTDSIQSKL